MKKLLLFLCFLAIGSLMANAKIKPTQLTCEYLKNPSVVDVRQPRLAWINVAEEGERGQVQTAYQIRVATTKDQLSNPDLWDSRKVESNASTRVEYDGDKLVSRQACWWQVRVWDNKGKVTAWSKPSFWEAGILDTKEWKASWITMDEEVSDESLPSQYYRNEFSCSKKVKSARVYVTSLGLYQLFLNGEKVGDQLFTPGFTSYKKRIQYQTYDVTSSNTEQNKK